MNLIEKILQNSDFTLWELLHLNNNSKQTLNLLCFKSTINVDQALVLPNVNIFMIKKQLSYNNNCISESFLILAKNKWVKTAKSRHFKQM